MCGRDDPFYFTLPISVALGFKIFCNAALRGKSLPTPELCDPNQAFVHYMLENGFTVLSLENKNLSREKKIKTAEIICSAGFLSISSRCVSLHFKSTSSH